MFEFYEFMQFVYSYYNCNPGGHSGESLIREMTNSEDEAKKNMMSFALHF